MDDGNEKATGITELTADIVRRYRDQVHASVPGLLVHAGDRILHCNESLARLLGYESPRMVMDLPGALRLVPEDVHFAERQAYERCLNGTLPRELRRTKRLRADTSVQWLDQHLERVDWGGQPAVLEILGQVRVNSDATELPHQWQLLQAAIDAMPNGVLMMDSRFRVEGINSEFLRLWDYPPGMFPPGTPVQVMLRYNYERGDYGDVEPESTIAELTRRFEVKGVVNSERLVPNNGRILDIRTAPRADGGVVVTHVDITDRKRIENELREAKERAETILRDLREAQQQLIVQEKMASLGQLTAGIAHELKNPLNFVNNFAELSGELLDELNALVEPLADQLPPDRRADFDDLLGDLQGNLRKIADHGRRADNIVKSMLAHSRGGSGEWRATDLNALVEESLALAYHAARAQDRGFNVTFDRRFDPAVGMIDIVPQDVSRVLVNLFTNAFYSVRKRQQNDAANYRPLLTVTTSNCEDKVLVKVRDNGMGMRPAVIEKLFTPFFTTKPTGEGTGLGLSLSYDIVVHQHRGRFDVSSVENDYAEFTITLPRTVPAVSLGERRKP